jgi:hypothetical protein
MGKTEQNLEAAFAGESQANRKYLFFAERKRFMPEITCGWPVELKLPRPISRRR